jgi:hypothetical protein
MDITIDSEITELHEPEHIDQVFDALTDTLDTVAGTEGLTRAQTYMWGVLDASGDLSYKQRVAGTEGFFSDVADGIAKVWGYIMKMFNAILNFFGLGDSNKGPSITEQTDAILKQNQANIAVLTGHRMSNADDISKQMLRTQADLDVFMNGPQTSPSEKSEAQELKHKLKEVKALPAPEQQRVVKEVVERFVKINSRMQRALDDQCQRALDEYKTYQVIVTMDHSNEFVGTSFADMYSTYSAAMKHNASKEIEAWVRIPQGLRTLNDAARAQGELEKAIKDLDSESTSISRGIKADVINQIKKLEEMVKRKDLRDAARSTFDRNLKACRLILSLTTSAIKQLRVTCENIRRISNMINRYFSVITD